MAEAGTSLRTAIARAAIGLRQLGWARLIVTALLLATALIIARFAWQLPLSIEAERALYDWRQALTAEKVDQDGRMVQVVYTDETLEMTGKRSPLDRAILAKALARIDSFAPKAIGIDVLIDQAQPEDEQIIAAFKAMKTPTYLAFASADTAEEKIKPWQQAFLVAFQKAIANPNVRPASIMIETDDDDVLRSWPRRSGNGPPLLPVAMGGATGSDYARYDGSIAYRAQAIVERPVFATLPIETFAEDALFESPEAAAIFRQQIAGKYVFIGGHIQDIDIFDTPVKKLTRSPMWGPLRTCWRSSSPARRARRSPTSRNRWRRWSSCLPPPRPPPRTRGR